MAAVMRTNMTKTLIISSSLLLLCAACSTPSLAERMDALAESVTSEEPLDEESYQAYADEYQMLLGEFSANLDSYSTEEKKQIIYDIGRINGVMASHSTGGFLRGVIGAIESVPNLVNGFREGFDVESLPLEELEGKVNDLRDNINNFLNNNN